MWNRTRSVSMWVWQHASAAIALALIIIALMIGYRLGRPSPAEEVTDATEAPADAAAQLYTCSMHPSVRLPDPDAKCPICFMDLIPAGEEVPGAERQLVLDEAAAREAGIETTRVGRFFPTAEVRLYGIVAYDETSVARISAYFPGRLDRLFVNYVGISVSAGDHLAEIYSPELLAAFEELRQAKRAVDEGAGSELVMR
ncbi:MAG: efflux RND transporter periplasmic adaptor subunit, partial [Planctomycetota bacterium]